ncbi:hypothetical protein [Psychroserpens sp. SPM9]|uniref:hypothetical protein n=1 Tax=Psychroserpens sp. SPM9 TaxID=2975598 RepID=UPI0021A82161|nr:hypothetical protein [Psychroserpens sp. SPM9]MDG5490703.1 hypothetical protein [Psychroserpens sp. SPM9]
MLETLKTNILAEIKLRKTEEEVAKNERLTKTYNDLNYRRGYIHSENICRPFHVSLKE